MEFLLPFGVKLSLMLFSICVSTRICSFEIFVEVKCVGTCNTCTEQTK
jgi:hypothetical protein